MIRMIRMILRKILDGATRQGMLCLGGGNGPPPTILRSGRIGRLVPLPSWARLRARPAFFNPISLGTFGL